MRMKRMFVERVLCRRLAGFAAIVAISTSVSVADVPGVITKTGGQRISGVIRWQPASRVYMVTTKENVALKVGAGEVARIQVRKPAELASAVQMVQAGRHAAAIPALEKIMAAYAMLEWDIPSGIWLAEAHLKSDSAKKSVQVCEALISAHPEVALSGELASVYWDALLESGQFAKLRRHLTEAIARGSRDVAALAQIKRGDIDRKEGNLKEALVDGYLRTIVLFNQVREVQPEALFKAAKCFEELGQHSYAEKMRKRLLAEFPQDSYTKNIKSGG